MQVEPRQGVSLFGDYYLLQQGSTGPGSFHGGFRATGGLLIGPRGTPWVGAQAGAPAWRSGYGAQRRSFSLLPAAMADTEDAGDSMSYLGVGYTGLQSLRGTGGGWGFSADVGVVALKPRSTVRFGQLNAADARGDLQLSPVLQLGVSYAF